MSTLTMTNTATLFGATTSTDLRPATWADWRADWLLPQEVVVFGSPADAGEGGRLAVREHAEALRQLRDN